MIGMYFNISDAVCKRGSVALKKKKNRENKVSVKSLIKLGVKLGKKLLVEINVRENLHIPRIRNRIFVVEKITV